MIAAALLERLSDKRAVLLIPARNEHEGIEAQLRIIESTCQQVSKAVVICDSIDDPTLEVVKRVALERLEVEGLASHGSGVAQAIRFAMTRTDEPIIALMPADEILPLLSLGSMVDHVIAGYALVSGTRYAKSGARYGGSAKGRTFSRTANWIVKLRSGGHITDLTTGVKVWRRDQFAPDLLLDSAGWSSIIGMTLACFHRGLPYFEVGIVSCDRPMGGKSSMQFGQWVGAYGRELWRSRKRIYSIAK